MAGQCVLYWRLLRPRILTWGATGAEAGARLPGDELLEGTDGVSTRAVWIDAPAATVWPWLAQMGPEPRGGAYTYDWIENILGLGMHSVDHVLPEPAPADRRHYRPGLQPDAHRARRPGARPRVALGRRQLGLDVRGGGARRTHTPDQPQPLPASEADRAHRDAADGAWISGDGTQDAARDQTAWRAPGGGANHITGYHRPALSGQPSG